MECPQLAKGSGQQRTSKARPRSLYNKTVKWVSELDRGRRSHPGALCLLCTSTPLAVPLPQVVF